MATLPELIKTADELGVFTYYLPFLLVFLLFYAILMKTKIFGEDRRIAFFISLIVGLYVMTMGNTLGIFITSLFGGGSIILLVILLIMMVAGLVVGDRAWDSFSGGRPFGGLILFAIVVGVFLFWLSGGFELLGIEIPGLDGKPGELPVDIDQDTLILIGILIVFMLLIWWMVGTPRLRGIEIVPRF